MNSFSLLMDGFVNALTWQTLLFALIGCILGTLIGALPGLGPANGVAILIPLVFSLGLNPAESLVLLTSVYAGAMYGGRISSILLNIPGDEPALMTTLDGYPMAKQGKAAEALMLSAVASFIGSLIATIGLVMLAPLLAKAALQFGSPEYVALYVLAFAALGGITSQSLAKTLIATALGLMIATIGIDKNTSTPRYTFDILELYEGIDFIVVLVGMFAISELLMFIEAHNNSSKDMIKVNKLRFSFKEVVHILPTSLRGSFLGFLAGVLPGAGASLGSFISYTLEKKVLGKKGHFGTGDPRGVAAPEAGNNAAANGALVPMLTLGVPGSGTTAVLLAMLVSLNITPGPMLFQQNADLVWTIIAALFIGNVMLLVLNIPMIGFFVKILSIPPRYLMPLVTIIAILGIYSISHSLMDIYLMIGFGVFGYFMRKLGVPVVPIILGMLLGPDLETSLRHSLMISDGNWLILWQSPLAIGLWIVAIAGLILPMIIGPILRTKMKQATFRDDISD
ncbi:tripartite tricarboxylate transporter permease [Suttonella sp. R2A3]|uniref:tripartite tricarboxylate transporter permease n=1 Tax=Suttonella sp. R2A3 TaxID=2908648 RepID=UPI001F366EEC|nr:tripartite tricarboxylate transporter permease [Suttonella sp. R2A3]UJF24757.1 tripartite tricarboxylate transporter permease [Suttonella sp. R2A3]